jgi:23S rRNA pseudouridine1911/1915/1917 synthase
MEKKEESAASSFKFDGASKERLDKVVAELFPELSRSWLKANIGKGLVLVNGVVASKAGQNVKRGDIVTVHGAVKRNVAAEVRSQTFFELVPNPAVELVVLYEDDDVVVLNKPKGQVVHPSKESGSNFQDSLCNGLVARYGVAGLAPSEDGSRPGIVHRLDSDTSGVMVVARNEVALKVLVSVVSDFGKLIQEEKALQAQFASDKKSMERVYIAIVAGGFGKNASSGTIDAPIGRHPKHGTKRCVRSDSDSLQSKKQNVKSAVTHWKVEEKKKMLRTFFTCCKVREEFSHVAVVECRLETGRTHQIRVHMKHIHHPLLCDPLYGTGNMPCASVEAELGKILSKHNVSG